MNSNQSKNTRAIIAVVVIGILLFNIFIFNIFLRSEGGDPPFFLFFCGIAGIIILLIVVWRLAIAYTRRRLGVPDITLSKESLQVGESFTVNFHHTFNNNITIERITIQLINKETAIYQQGTDTRTVIHEDIHEAFEIPGGDFRAGHMISDVYKMQIPADGMHTLKVRRNQIQWFVRVEAVIPKLADFVEERELIVVPELAAS